MPRMVKYTLIIEETFGPTSGADRKSHPKYSVVKRELLFPVDSKGTHVYKSVSRATMDLLYGLADHDYLNVTRGITDLLHYDRRENGE
ncbi:hypothetical protein LCGC14_2464450 [marine sediment metagenome]|uniref:Uncharacterized protein n=1 Tax=marine sediment metagenome TaxID=412755 RepID=A0A0F9BC96_9ZZZZ